MFKVEDIKIKQDFYGLPIPITAITIASVVLFYHNGVNIVKPFDFIFDTNNIYISIF